MLTAAIYNVNMSWLLKKFIESFIEIPFCLNPNFELLYKNDLNYQNFLMCNFLDTHTECISLHGLSHPRFFLFIFFYIFPLFFPSLMFKHGSAIITSQTFPMCFFCAAKELLSFVLWGDWIGDDGLDRDIMGWCVCLFVNTI